MHHQDSVRVHDDADMPSAFLEHAALVLFLALLIAVGFAFPYL